LTLFAEGNISNKKKTGPSFKAPGVQRRNSNFGKPSLKDGSNKKLKTFIRSNTQIGTKSQGRKPNAQHLHN